MTQPIFTPEELAEVLAYHRPAYLYSAFSELINLAVFVLVLRYCIRPFYRLAQAGAAAIGARCGALALARAPVARALVRVLERLWGGPGWGAAVLFVAIQMLFVIALFLPVDVYFGYILEHRHGLSRHTPASFTVDLLKGTAIRFTAKVAVAFGLYGLARRVRRWWLALGLVAGTLLLFSGLLDPLRSQVHFDQEPLPRGPLRDRLTALMARAEVSFADIRVERASRTTRKVQAYFAGQGPTRTIVLNDNLLRELSEAQIAAAVAHEAGHLQESQWPGRIGAALTLLAFLAWTDRLLRLAARRRWFGATEFADVRTLPLVSLSMYVLLTVAAPASAALSRERERQADRYAIELTKDPETYAAMLVRAARVNKMDPSPPLWIALQQSHPPIAERLELLERPR